MKVSYSLNGQPLDSERMRVIVGTTHYTSLSPIIDTVQVSGRSGVIVGSSIPVLDAPELTIKVAAWGADSDALISRFRARCCMRRSSRSAGRRPWRTAVLAAWSRERCARAASRTMTNARSATCAS